MEPWTYIRLSHLKKVGWTGLKDGPGTSLYRVGPLARLNVADGMATPMADKEMKFMFDITGWKTGQQHFSLSLGPLIEALQASETMVKIANNPILPVKISAI